LGLRYETDLHSLLSGYEKTLHNFVDNYDPTVQDSLTEREAGMTAATGRLRAEMST